MGLGVLVAFFVRWYRAALAGEREDAAQMAKISDSIDDVSMAEARKEVLPLLSSNPFFYTEAAAGRQYLHPELPESIRELFSLYGAIIYLGVGIRSDWLPGPNENVQRIKIGEELDEDIVVVPGSIAILQVSSIFYYDTTAYSASRRISKMRIHYIHNTLIRGGCAQGVWECYMFCV
jgi:hypothetical protein